MEKRFEYYAQLAAVLLLVVGCFVVLRPFLTAILFAAVVCISTWPLYQWLLNRMKGRQTLAALAMTLSLVIIIILPLALVASSLADNVTAFYGQISASIEEGPLQLPDWLTTLPLVGEPIQNYWQTLSSSQEEMAALLKRLLEPTRKFLLAGGILLGQGVMEMTLAAFVSFFFYRDAAALVASLKVAMEKLTGTHALNILDTVSNTVSGVMYGILGTALAQGFVAAIGFALAGVPAVLLLGVATFVLSLVPAGPPLIWGGATLWLFSQGSTGWGIFMLLWGVLVISSVDNVLKPILISRGSNLPFALVMFGVMGGVLAFGFVGMFIGPALLAVGFNLIRKWTQQGQNSVTE